MLPNGHKLVVDFGGRRAECSSIPDAVTAIEDALASGAAADSIEEIDDTGERVKEWAITYTASIAPNE
jgi:hypothetical protein